MSEEDRALAIFTARLLAQGRWLGAFSLILSALGWWSPATAAMGDAAGVGLALVLGLFNLYAVVRVGLDATLFADMARERLQPEALDGALVTLGMADPPTRRGMAERCRGGMVWFKRLVFGLALQTILMLFLWFTARVLG